MLRVSRISVPALPAAGGAGLEVPGAGLDLAAFDLVVVYGPNGSGKSLLTAPLRDPPAGLVLVDAAGIEQAFGRGRALGMDRGLLVRTSAELMSEFQSLKAALGKAAGITRAADEGRILEKLLAPRGQHSLATLRPESSREIPLDIRQARDDFRHAEQRALAALGPDVPLSLAAYNSLGRQVAAITGRVWPEQAAVDAVAMRAAEEAVRPAPVMIRGSGDLMAACQRAAAALRGPDAQLLSAVEEAESLLAAAIAAAERLLVVPAGGARPAATDWPACCRAAAQELVGQADEEVRVIASLDALAHLRREAIDLVEPGTSPDCPVCAAPIHRERLLDALRAAVATTAPDLEGRRSVVKALREQARERELAAEKIDAALRGVAERNRMVEATISQWTGACGALVDAATPRAEWDARLRSLAEPLGTAAAAAGTEPEESAGDVPSRLKAAAARVAAAREAAAAAARAVEALDRTANQGIAEAERIFNNLVPLRELLVCRHGFNGRRWEPSWERDRDDAARNRLLDVWIEAAQGLRSDRLQRLANTEAEILGQPEVQRRFRGLLDALGHPLLAGVDLAAETLVQDGGVVIGGRRRDSRLSEGFTVLVNLAAFVAVAGYVAEGQEHEPGWVIIDEPTNGLDVENRRKVADYLGGLDRTAMPRQIFVTTCDDTFRRLLVAAAAGSGRRTLELRLPEWRGRFSAPESIDHRPTGVP